MRFNKAKYGTLHLGCGHSRCRYRLGDETIESSPAEKDLGILVGEKLDMTWQHAHSAESQPYPGLQHKKCGQQVEGGDSPSLLCSGEIPPGVLHPALGPSAQEGHGPVGTGPEKGHRKGQRAGAPLL
ncbi:sodium glucose cotransporter 1-like [Limosa lapponica baueri]|uniref:Sodium glucose cotransporter 1-like n=1 Tax=Limosa lapponica baueri TaxID=1758121 RepID=A0A2I0U438_LIMLA|nr:sodium glucose cotransporter 1-like [Limosa lapponica baueri]